MLQATGGYPVYSAGHPASLLPQQDDQKQFTAPPDMGQPSSIKTTTLEIEYRHQVPVV